jgi:hypothetical protein
MLSLDQIELDLYSSPHRVIRYDVEIKNLFDNGDWQDISDRLIDKVGISKEQDHKGSPSTNTFNFTLRNSDGYFSPNNGDSPIAQNLTENLEIRIFIKIFDKSAGHWYRRQRFIGYIESFKPNAKRQNCTVKGKDYMKDYIDKGSELPNEVFLDKTVTQAIKEIVYRVNGATTDTEKAEVDSDMVVDQVDKVIGFLDLRDKKPAQVLEEINLSCDGRTYFNEQGKFVFKSGLTWQHHRRGSSAHQTGRSPSGRIRLGRP